MVSLGRDPTIAAQGDTRVTQAESPIRRAIRVFELDSAHWHIASWLAWLLLVAPLLVMAGFMVLGVISITAFHALVDEDHGVEWLQFVVILAASIVFAIAAFRAARGGRRGLALLYLVVALASFVTAGEEISWGQRIFGWATPDVLEPINHQGESNVHNISIVQHAFNVGELLAGLYGVLIPLVWLSSPARSRLGRWLDPLLVPPLCLIALFFLPFAYRTLRYIFLLDAGQRITELGEIPELAFYLAVLIMGLVTVRALRPSEQTAA
jgi:hypothetical protein